MKKIVFIGVIFSLAVVLVRADDEVNGQNQPDESLVAVEQSDAVFGEVDIFPDAPDEVEDRDTINDNKPLVRCKRPMCDDLSCSKGYQLDSRGCETCICLTSECDTRDCRPGFVCKEQPCTSSPCTMLLAECIATEPTAPPHLPCPMPMCAKPCPYGRKVTSEGCETCECSTTEPEPKIECPMMKCGMCAFGYVRDDNGCHSCNCLPDPCLGKECPAHQECTARWADCSHVPCPKTAVCTWRGLCQYHNDNKEFLNDLHVSTDGMSTDCNEDGTFNPIQCSSDRKQCWCVDDLGRDTGLLRQKVNSDADMPFCPYNRTVSIVMTFILESEGDVDISVPSLKTTIHEHVSRWLLIEKHYINEFEIWEEPNSVIVVSYNVVHDGKTDLPSAASHLSRQMQRGQCSIDLNGNRLTPRADSLQMEHTFEPIAAPRVSNPGLLQGDHHNNDRCFLRRWYYHHRTAFLVGAIGGCIILTLASAVIICALVKRRRRMVQFNHKRMSNYQKNLSLVAESCYLPNDEKKEPLNKDDVVNLCDSTEQLIPAESSTSAVA